LGRSAQFPRRLIWVYVDDCSRLSDRSGPARSSLFSAKKTSVDLVHADLYLLSKLEAIADSSGTVPCVTMTENARPKRSPRAEAKRRKIMDVTAEVLVRRGYGATTLAEIAEGAGTLAGSLYYHFDSREDLVAEVLVEGVHALTSYVEATLAAMAPATNARERLETALRAHLDYVLDRSAYARAGVRSIGQNPPEIHARFWPAVQEYGVLLSGLFDDAAEEGFIDPAIDRSALRLLVVGAANWSTEWHRPDGRVSAHQLGDLLVSMIFDGVQPKPTT
jgi:TetR/AcrR family transcriptional regulator, cholesterol catabolism regulator